ncbi:MAG: hypothetical protein KAI33_08695, partial [Elusimicrobiales bacterium]|nr:hypothetical protein [Elusimicrobiales bacterium]
TVNPRTSISTYTVVASTSSYDIGVSTLVAYPGPTTHLEYVFVSTIVVAGESFSPKLRALDAYENVCSTGPNIYLGTVTFITQDQVNPNQDPKLIAASTNYYIADAGEKTLTGWFKLKKSGEDILGAEDEGDDTIDVSPLAGLTVIHGPPKGYKIDSYENMDIGAGSYASFGRLEFTAQLTDSYDNNISSAGLPAYMEMAEVYGSTGSFEYKEDVTWYDIGTSTLVLTDSNGTVGIETPLSYKISSKAGDWARVWIGTSPVNLLSDYVAKKQNVTGILTTIGGDPTKLVYVSSQPTAVVGITELGGVSGAEFTVERRDDFDNPSREYSTTEVYLMIPTAQESIHTDLGRTLGTEGNSDDYGFRNAGNAQFIDSINIYLGQTQATFRYHDRTASYSGVSPSSNTAEGERPGYWQLEAKSGIMQPAIHQLQMNPYEIAKVTFGNEQRSITAGKIVNSETGLNQSFKVELRDMFDNPSIATATVEVLLSTANRQASIFSDSFCFAASSAMSGAFPPIFESTVSFVTIPLDYYSATFYYLDTMASSGYEVALPTKPVIGLAVPERPTWQPSEQSVIVAPDTADRISVRDGIGQTIMAGATSQMFVMSLDDRFGNPTPVKSERVFGITSTSGGDVKMSSPNDDDFIDQPGTATLALGESTTSFYIIDTLISETTHQLVVDEIDSQGWTAAISSYTVVAAPPDHVVFVTDSRRLITGTTVQYSDYELGITTSTQIRVGLRDIYENATTTDTDVNVRFIADKNSTYGGISGDEEVSASNPNWQVLKTNPLNVTIYAGYSDTGIYIWDTVVGTSTISALATITADSITLPEVNQEEYITPNKATHFTLEHLFTS